MRSVTTKHNRQTALQASQGGGSNQSQSGGLTRPHTALKPSEIRDVNFIASGSHQ
jgi:hypothetical protein